MTASANDTQHGGDHYKKLGQFQPWDVLQAWLTPEEYRGWQKGVTIVYLARERDKGGDQDIMKAGHHIEKLVEVMTRQAAAQKATDAEAALNKGVVPLEQALASGAVPDSFFEQLSRETAAMGRDEALEYTNNALDERESLRQLGLEGVERVTLPDGVVKKGHMVWWLCTDGPRHVKSDSANHWENLKMYPGSYRLEQPGNNTPSVEGLAEVKTFENPTANAVRELDHSAWTAVLDTGNDSMSLASPRTTAFSDKVKVLSPEGWATYSVDIAECLADMVFLKKRLTDIDRDEPNRFTQSIRRLDGAIALLNILAPLFVPPAE